MHQIDRLAEQVGSGTLLRDIPPRLRCQRCGEPPPAVLLCDGGGPSKCEVWLMGEARGGGEHATS
jgi:hypothetical protein